MCKLWGKGEGVIINVEVMGRGDVIKKCVISFLDPSKE